MRTELELRYKAENILVQAKDGISIDCMYLKAESEDSSEDNNGTIVVMCNPNGEYYEYAIDMQDHWISFYRKNGINMLLWNYRGYNRSGGYPTPNNILSDGECVVQYLRDVRGTGHVLIHGQSLGGVVASYVAARLGCDFLFADRAFSTLDAIAEVTAGSFAARLLKLLTNWHLDCTNAFLSSQCYKVVSNDSNDTIVTEIASLKSGIAEKISKENAIYGRSVLSDSEIYVLYKNITDLYDMIKEFDAVPKKRIKRKKNERTKSQDLTILSEMRVRTLSDGEIRIPIDNDQLFNGRAITYTYENEYIVSAEYIPPEKYRRLMNEGNKKECSAVLNILNAVVDEIDKLDSAGSTLSRIMKDKQHCQIRLLKGFFMNLDVWGSQPVIRSEDIIQPIPTIAESRMRAYVFLSLYYRAKSKHLS